MTVTLSNEESHHARDVLRLRVGDAIGVFDGGGNEFECRIESMDKSAVTAAVTSKIEPAAPESALCITLASVVIPGEKYDLIVQKAVELGVTTLVPLTSIRAEVDLKSVSKKKTRWERIAFDAAKQCGRARLMMIAEPMPVTDLMASAETVGRRIFFSERDGTGLETKKVPSSILAVVGPKGGWDDIELSAAKAAGFEIVTLGGRIMRAETAAIALTAILQHRFGDIN